MNSFDPFREPANIQPELDLEGQRAYSEMLLNDLRERRRTEGGRWLTELVQESIVNNVDVVQPDAGQEYDIQGHMLCWLEHMFDEFDRYITDFNASGTDLFVSSTRPSWNPSAELGDGVSRCQGHLTTRFWCMYFNAVNETLQVFILPADLLLAFNTGLGDRVNYQPFITIDSKIDDRGFCWKLGETQIAANQLSALARELFSDFIRIASGKIFDHHAQANQLPPLAEIAEALAQRAEASVCEPPSMTSDAALSFEPPMCVEQSNPLVSARFARAMDEIILELDQELIWLSATAGKAAQMSDLLTLARCKRLVLELSQMRDQISGHTMVIESIVADPGNRAAA